jgi:hypothetical protein
VIGLSGKPTQSMADYFMIDSFEPADLLDANSKLEHQLFRAIDGCVLEMNKQGRVMSADQCVATLTAGLMSEPPKVIAEYFLEYAGADPLAWMAENEKQALRSVAICVVERYIASERWGPS